jgi:hypothetical protein
MPDAAAERLACAREYGRQILPAVFDVIYGGGDVTKEQVRAAMDAAGETVLRLVDEGLAAARAEVREADRSRLHEADKARRLERRLQQIRDLPCVGRAGDLGPSLEVIRAADVRHLATKGIWGDD